VKSYKCHLGITESQVHIIETRGIKHLKSIIGDKWKSYIGRWYKQPVYGYPEGSYKFIIKSRSYKSLGLCKSHIFFYQIMDEQTKLKMELIGNVYSWGSWDYGWHGKVIVIKTTKQYVYYTDVYDLQDITFIKNEVTSIDDKWYIHNTKCWRLTHLQFQKKVGKSTNEQFIYKTNLNINNRLFPILKLI
jgi:hypothetical protein